MKKRYIQKEETLTKKQRAVLAHIWEFWRSSGRFPSYYDLAKCLGLKSKRSIAQFFDTLERKGYISRKNSIPLTAKALEFLIDEGARSQGLGIAPNYDVVPRVEGTQQTSGGGRIDSFPLVKYQREMDIPLAESAETSPVLPAVVEEYLQKLLEKTAWPPGAPRFNGVVVNYSIGEVNFTEANKVNYIEMSEGDSKVTNTNTNVGLKGQLSFDDLLGIGKLFGK